MRNRRRLSFAPACIWLCWFGAIGVLDLAAAVGAESEQQTYAIPAQDLKQALNAYAAASGLQVLYETSLVAGRGSGAVSGHYPAMVALDRLLIGTGLIGRRTDVDAVTVLLRPQQRVEPLSEEQRMFLGQVQAGITVQLCGAAETQPRDYRVAVQLWLTDYGTVRQANLLSSTGSFRRDDAITQALQRLNIGVAPPPGIRQPLTMALMPQDSGRACTP